MDSQLGKASVQFFQEFRNKAGSKVPGCKSVNIMMNQVS
jgi:hypothetical protein